LWRINPTGTRVSYRPDFKAYIASEARLLVDTASGVARSVDLAYLHELSTVARRIDLDETARKSAELNILGSAVRWHGVDF
jgi:hypothetical protein